MKLHKKNTFTAIIWFMLLASMFIFLVPVYALDKGSEKKTPSKYSKKKIRRSLRRKKIQIDEKLKKQLVELMVMTSRMHRLNSLKKEKLTTEQMKKIIQYLSEIQLSMERLNYHHKMYLIKQLQRIEDSLKFIIEEGRSDERKIASFKQVYRETIQIYKTYSLSNSLKKHVIFYCDKDNSVWIQSTDYRSYHPFDRFLKRCGQPVR